MTRNHWFSGALLAFSMAAATFGDLNFSTSEESATYYQTTHRVQLSSDLIYNNMNLQQYGLSKEALNYAVEGYNNLMNEDRISNPRYLTIVDFSKKLTEKRFFLLDLENQEVVMNTYVMHGKNSGKEMAGSFSNTINSNKSSLGFYLTRGTYTGKRGPSLRLEGLEDNFNSNALERAIVLHGSNYISDSRAKKGKVGRSEGCPAIPMPLAEEVIDLVKGGSVIFIYYPSETYLQQSPVLNSMG